MTDELLYAKLARHIADTGSPLPVLHGEHVGFLGVVYPMLLAPLYAALDPVAAFDAAHVAQRRAVRERGDPGLPARAARRAARVRAGRRRCSRSRSRGR